MRSTKPFIDTRTLLFLMVLLAFGAAFVARATFFVESSSAAETGTDIFSASCRPSHIAPDDPIVFPGQPGAAHMHEFSGAMSTDAFTTPQSLVASGSTCDPKEDTGAYWMPVLYVKGKRVPVGHTTAYYAKGRKNSSAQRTAIKAWPQGFRMIADLKNATESISGYPHAGWMCGSTQVKWGYNSSLKDIIYHCPYALQVRIVFPDCWDGVNLDTVKPDGTSAINPVTKQAYPNDHRSHVAYAPSSGDCPKNHPVGTPRLDYKVTYKTKGLTDSAAHRPATFSSDSKIQKNTPYDAPLASEGSSPADFTLAGGGLNGTPIATTSDVDTFHADFYNGWKQDKLESLIDYCIRKQLAITDTRPCLNPNSDATQDAPVNPNYPNATQPAVDTIITSAPVTPMSELQASAFAFKASLPGATFACKLDSAAYSSCGSPQTYLGLSAGTHTFSVRATLNGQTDLSPATKTWTVGASSTPPPPPPPGPITLPTVSISAPAAGATVSGTITASVAAMVSPATVDGTNISKVVFMIDGATKATDTTSPYQYSIDTTSMADGEHTLAAVAHDKLSPANTSTTSVTFTVANGTTTPPPANGGPVVKLTSPTAGQTVSGQFYFTATATDADKVDKAELLIDGAVVKTSTADNAVPYKIQWATTQVPNGSHTVQVRATDKLDNATTTPAISVKVSN